MLPHISTSESTSTSTSTSASSSSSSSIHINPKFRNVHINPNFLGKLSNGDTQKPPSSSNARPQIYINPRFFNNPMKNEMISTAQVTTASAVIHPVERQMYKSAQENYEDFPVATEPLADTKIHTRKKIMNASKPIIVASINTSSILQPTNNLKPLIKIGSKKLIRICSNRTISKPSNAIAKVRRPIQTKYKIVKEQTAFKIDRRTAKSKLVASSLRKLLAQSLHKKQWIKENLMPLSTVIGNATKLKRMTSSTTKPTSQKSLTYLNINGILYKANQRKLEKTTTPNQKYSINKTKTNPNADPSYRRLTVRGESFLLDANGKNLIKVQNEKPTPNNASRTIKRIDIGKITFMKKSNGTFERTDFHKSRFHLNEAKQRSIQMLTNRLVKTNVPCPIYRKLGKCAAFERRKCTKLHDNKLVDVCPRFLKGTCDKASCLLSHNTTLSKMPTCKFYLQGLCSKTDCPYLHKKVNDKTDICVDFLRGYCELAEKCPKRHEFLCPEEEAKGFCKLTRCPHPHRSQSSKTLVFRSKSKSKPKAKNAESIAVENDEKPEKLSGKRYFTEDANQTEETVQCVNKNSVNDNSATVETTASAAATTTDMVTTNDELSYFGKRPKLGTLPSFIPIG